MKVVITFGCHVKDLSLRATANDLAEILQLPMDMFLNFLKQYIVV